MWEAILSFIAGKTIGLTGIWGARQMLKIIKAPILRKIETRMMIDVPKDGHFVICGGAEKNISFDVLFTRPYSATLKIKHIEYQISYGDKIRQRNQWEGCVILNTDRLRTKIQLLYHTAESPMGIPESACGWKLTGTATIESMYGKFKKDFESVTLTVTSATPWEELRAGSS